jgi:hypothetical protein
MVLRPKFDGVWGLVSTSRGGGSLLGGRWGQWVVEGGYPRRPLVHRKGGAGGGGDRDLGLGTRQKNQGNRLQGLL